MFEEVSGHKDCLQRCIIGMGGAFSKAQISRQLKIMGLKKNKLTLAQVCIASCKCGSEFTDSTCGLLT